MISINPVKTKNSKIVSRKIVDTTWQWLSQETTVEILETGKLVYG